MEPKYSKRRFYKNNQKFRKLIIILCVLLLIGIYTLIYYVMFKKNLSFWKNIEGGKTHTQAGPTFSAVRKFQLSLGQERQVAVVSQWDSPGGKLWIWRTGDKA